MLNFTKNLVYCVKINLRFLSLYDLDKTNDFSLLHFHKLIMFKSINEIDLLYLIIYFYNIELLRNVCKHISIEFYSIKNFVNI